MFFDEIDIHGVDIDQFLFAAHAPINDLPYVFQSRNDGDTPTHTEDGIPIRKIYVTNLPPKITRKDLFNVFASYGYVKSCWLKSGDKFNNKPHGPAYAFVTFVDPADAHNALKAPSHEKSLRGVELRTFPADSWHQPVEDKDGNVLWNSNGILRNNKPSRNTEPNEESTAASTNDETNQGEPSSVTDPEPSSSSDPQYTILDVLNQDCLFHIMSYLPISTIIQSERVCKQWRNMTQEYIAGMREFKTTWWHHSILTTAILRELLKRLGPSLLRLHIDNPCSALNDRTAHTIGKFCPNLEELKVMGMHTKNWNPLMYGCTELKSLTFISCNKLTDTSLTQVLKNNSKIEQLTVALNTHITGQFLGAKTSESIQSLSFYNCFSLQGAAIISALDSLPRLTTLKIDQCPLSMWITIPSILEKLPRLVELSLSEYLSADVVTHQQSFCESLKGLKDLEVLNMWRNVFVSDEVLKTVAQTCKKLKKLDISCCYAQKGEPYRGVTDVGIHAICKGCPELRELDISYLTHITDEGVAALATLSNLRSLTVKGVSTVTSDPFCKCLPSWKVLEMLDLSGCCNVSEAVVEAANSELESHPRRLELHVAGTGVSSFSSEEQLSHKLLYLNIEDDRSDCHLRHNYMDRFFDSNDDILNDLYDPDDYDFDFEDSDDDDHYNYMDDFDDDDEDEDDFYHWEHNFANILLL